MGMPRWILATFKIAAAGYQRITLRVTHPAGEWPSAILDALVLDGPPLWARTSISAPRAATPASVHLA